MTALMTVPHEDNLTLRLVGKRSVPDSRFGVGVKKQVVEGTEQLEAEMLTLSRSPNRSPSETQG